MQLHRIASRPGEHRHLGLHPVVAPTLWWPEDQSWFVAGDSDFAWTYVAGPEALIEAIESSPSWRRFVRRSMDGTLSTATCSTNPEPVLGPNSAPRAAASRPPGGGVEPDGSSAMNGSVAQSASGELTTLATVIASLRPKPRRRSRHHESHHSPVPPTTGELQHRDFGTNRVRRSERSRRIHDLSRCGRATSDQP